MGNFDWFTFFKKCRINEFYALQYAYIFMRHDIDETTIDKIQKEDFVYMGIKYVGHILKILRYIKEMKKDTKM
ncbi:hypothetical protein B4U80_14695, partial [Leptotrombidium deliense]